MVQIKFWAFLNFDYAPITIENVVSEFDLRPLKQYKMANMDFWPY